MAFHKSNGVKMSDNMFAKLLAVNTNVYFSRNVSFTGNLYRFYKGMASQWFVIESIYQRNRRCRPVDLFLLFLDFGVHFDRGFSSQFCMQSIWSNCFSPSRISFSILRYFSLLAFLSFHFEFHGDFANFKLICWLFSNIFSKYTLEFCVLANIQYAVCI